MKVFVISMDTPNGKARLSTMTRRCAEAGLDDFEHVVGVDGKRVSSEHLDRHVGTICKTLCAPMVVGVAMSHMQCWQAILDNDLEMALILEDDAVLLPNFQKRMEAAVQNVPKDFHILLLGCFTCGQGIQKAFGAPALPQQDIVAIKYFAGTHAYVMSRAGAQFATQHIRKVHYHIDIQMNRTPGLRIYAVKDHLAIQDGEATSSNADIQFPGSVNSFLSTIRDADNISMAYYANTSIFRIGSYRRHIIVTPLLILFFVAGALGLSWRYMLGFAAVDVILYPPSSPVDLATKLGAFIAGMLSRRWRYFTCARR